jgi:hypothetical protein
VRSASQLLLLAGLLAILAGWWFGDSLPSVEHIDSSVTQEPEQTATRVAPFAVSVGDIEYRIKPVFDYEIDGLIVSEHDSASWHDIVHADWNDRINVVDLCMVWGVNAAEGAYRRMEFSSGQFVCYWRTQTMADARADYVRALSNNHLLTADPRIAKRLRDLHIGDQVRIRGQLVEYSHDHGFAFHRGTSTTRDDTGDGACETIFVRDLTVIRRGSAWPRMLTWLGVALLLAGVVAWFKRPLSFND